MSCKLPEKLPWVVEEIDADTKKKLKKILPEKLFKKISTSLKVGPKKYTVTPNFREKIPPILHFKVRPDDVWLLGYPRSGTTLTQEIVWLLGNNLNYEAAAQNIIDHRFPMVDRLLIMDVEQVNQAGEQSNASSETKEIVQKYSKEHYKQFEENKGRRFIKCHLPISLMSPDIFDAGCKVIFCARNPKDCIVSNFHIQKLFNMDEFNSLDFKTFWYLYKNNLGMYTPYFDYIKEGWAKRNDKNVLFLFYEDTMKNKNETIKKIAKLLERDLTEAELAKLLNHIEIDNFRKNKSVNNDHFIEVGLNNKNKEHEFIRKGKVGGWRDYFTPELNEEADRWIEENLAGSDLVFPAY